jgi:sigma-B regulation protein RsbU (phosphoserine phosphatase)
MLPADSPRIDGYEVVAFNRPIRSDVGDILGFVPLRDGRLAIVLGDVAGLVDEIHARQATVVCESLADILARETSPDAVLTALNHRLTEENDDFCVKLVVAAIDPHRHIAEIADAANSYSFVIRSNCVSDRLCDHIGIPLGVVDNVEFEQQRISLDRGDQLLFCTDGVIEAMGEGGEMYGLERLTDRLPASNTRPAETLESVTADLDHFVSGHQQSDDMSMICIGRNHRPGDISINDQT